MFSIKYAQFKIASEFQMTFEYSGFVA